MTRQEKEELQRLSQKWATQRATYKEMRRVMALERKAEADRKRQGGL
mgnify:CR=1 FL=1